jgi:hypothetical protein
MGDQLSLLGFCGEASQPCQYWSLFGNQALWFGSGPFQAPSQVVDPQEAVVRQEVSEVFDLAFGLFPVGDLHQDSKSLCAP